MDHRQLVERYYRAFRHRDREALRSLLTPDFRHLSAHGEWRDRDAMLEAIWPAVGEAWATRLQIFGEPPELMVRYENETAPGVRRPRRAMAEYVRFEGDRIAEIEVYVGREVAAPPPG
jgi:ketosteroid isomerase-like protein